MCVIFCDGDGDRCECEVSVRCDGVVGVCGDDVDIVECD